MVVEVFLMEDCFTITNCDDEKQKYLITICDEILKNLNSNPILNNL